MRMTDRWLALIIFMITIACLYKGMNRYEREQQQDHNNQGEQQ